MRKLIVSNIVSLDGYYIGGPDWPLEVMDTAFDEYNAERLREVGSRTLWHQLLENEPVDELHLMIGALVRGGGTPVFAAAPKTALRLVGTRTWPDSANVLIKYDVAGASRS